MIKTVYEKWLEIEKSEKGVDEIFVSHFYLSKKTKTNLYLGVENGKKIAYLEFSIESLSNYNSPSLLGMEINAVDAPFIDPTKKYILIKNISNSIEIFYAFISSLCDELIDTTSYLEAFQALGNVIKEYKDYFSDSNKALSLKEEQGLCAELLEFKKVINIYGEEAVLNWQGPNKNKRDFVFEKKAVEIKSTTSQINTSILISNENQLDQTFPEKLDKLYLKVYVMETVESGINVISCINNVLDVINDVSLKNIFLSYLLKLKVDMNYKPKYNFSIQKENYYIVDDKFPKITKNSISPNIYDVKYRLNIETIEDFIVSEEKVYG